MCIYIHCTHLFIYIIFPHPFSHVFPSGADLSCLSSKVCEATLAEGHVETSVLLKELPWQHPLANLDGASAVGNWDAADAADSLKMLKLGDTYYKFNEFSWRTCDSMVLSKPWDIMGYWGTLFWTRTDDAGFWPDLIWCEVYCEESSFLKLFLTWMSLIIRIHMGQNDCNLQTWMILDS